MKDNNRIAYEFRDTISLKYFLNKLYLNYYEDGVALSDLYENPLFKAVSNEHPVYVFTILNEPVYELTDNPSSDVKIINKGNIQEFINSLEQ